MAATAGANTAAGAIAFDTLGAAFWTTAVSATDEVGFGKGVYKSSGTSPVFSVQIAKVTGGNVVIRAGSQLKIRPI
jgi:hypothetical protein